MDCPNDAAEVFLKTLLATTHATPILTELQQEQEKKTATGK